MGVVIYMADNVTKRFGTRLRALRSLAYGDAKGMADVLGVRPGTYNRWERGEAEPPYSMLLKICQHLDVTPTVLLLGAVPERSEVLRITKKTRNQ